MAVLRFFVLAVSALFIATATEAADVPDTVLGKITVGFTTPPTGVNILGITSGMSRADARNRLLLAGYYPYAATSSAQCLDTACYKAATYSETYSAIGKGPMEDNFSITSTGVVGGEKVLSVTRRLLIQGSRDRTFSIISAETVSRLSAKYGGAPASVGQTVYCWTYSGGALMPNPDLQSCQVNPYGSSDALDPKASADITIAADISPTMTIILQDNKASEHYRQTLTALLKRVSGTPPEVVPPPNF